ncbi:MAG: hypothetical protein OXU20_24850 [Myxococcales bacterium]|nr:hypothetical protein [Myxococcales bacterium]
MLRGSTDFATEEAYESWLQDLVRRRNLGRSERMAQDLAAMRKLDAQRLADFTELTVPVTVEHGTGQALHLLGAIASDRRACPGAATRHPDPRGDLQYMRLLHLAAATTEAEVQAAIAQLLDAGKCRAGRRGQPET